MRQARLPRERGVARLLRTPLGGLIARPWFDGAALWALERWVFPLSRLWAAAAEADGSADRLCTAVPLAPRDGGASKLARALDRFDAAQAEANAADAAWDAALFRPDPQSPEDIVAAEMRRLDARHDLNATRRRFRFLLRRNPPPVRRNVASPAACEAVYGPFLGDPHSPFQAPDPMPDIEVSRQIPGPFGMHYWLRFPSPSERMGDRVHARVQEPEGVSNPPTLIYGHGVCVEFDHWHGMVDEAEAFVRMGFRVVRPEAPWHGRRTPAGYYGGERMIGGAPMAALDFFVAAVREWAVLMHWCRANTRAAVAVGGCSLGALTAQLTADRARRWPAELWPDALFLVTHCGRMEEAVLRGSMGRLWRVREASEAAGWTAEHLERYVPLLNQTEGPVVAPENIVSVLGTRDTVTPYDSGKALVAGWGLPAENLFLWDRGHFSVPLTLLRRHEPLDRLKTVMLRSRPGM